MTMIPRLDESNNVVGWVKQDGRQELHLLRHPKTGKVVQVVAITDAAVVTGNDFYRQLRDAIDSDPTGIHLAGCDYDVVFH